MVSSKAAIYSWFKGAVSSQRIEMMCSIFQLCLPNEIRFIAACLEDKARKDYALLREYETKSNEPSEYSAMTVVDLLDDTLQKRLIMYTSLLRSSNSVCANNLFQILTHLYEKLLFSHSQHNSRLTEILTDRQLAEDLILLFTLSAHHPAYVFSQRLRLFEMLIEVKRLLKSSGLIQVDDEDGCEESQLFFESPVPSCQIVSSASCQTTPPIALVDSIVNSIDTAHVTHIELKRNNSKNTENKHDFHVEVTWSDQEVADVYRSFKQLKNFSEELEKYLSKLLSKDVPTFRCQSEKNVQLTKHTTESVRKYLRDLSNLPKDILCDANVSSLFRELVRKSDVVVPPSPVALQRESNVQSPVVTSSSEPVLSIRSFEKLSLTIPATAQSTMSLSSPESSSSCIYSISSHTAENSMSNPTSIPSLPSSSQNAPCLSYSTMSRHHSLCNNGSVGSWLKDVRLHKYTANLSKYSWEQLFSITAEQLEKEGLTIGARNKFFSELRNLKEQGNNIKPLFVSTTAPGRPHDLGVSAFLRNQLFITSPVVSQVCSPASVDSSCSEYSTPPGSPEISFMTGRRHESRLVSNRHHYYSAADSVKDIKSDGLFIPLTSTISTNLPRMSSTKGLMTLGRTISQDDVSVSQLTPRQDVSDGKDCPSMSIRAVVPTSESKSVPPFECGSKISESSRYAHLNSTTQIMPTSTSNNSMPVRQFFNSRLTDGSRPAPQGGERSRSVTTTSDVVFTGKKSFNDPTSNLSSGPRSPMPIPSDAVLVRPRMPMSHVNVGQSPVMNQSRGSEIIFSSSSLSCAINSPGVSNLISTTAPLSVFSPNNPSSKPSGAQITWSETRDPLLMPSGVHVPRNEILDSSLKPFGVQMSQNETLDSSSKPSGVQMPRNDSCGSLLSGNESKNLERLNSPDVRTSYFQPSPSPTVSSFVRFAQYPVGMAPPMIEHCSLATCQHCGQPTSFIPGMYPSPTLCFPSSPNNSVLHGIPPNFQPMSPQHVMPYRMPMNGINPELHHSAYPMPAELQRNYPAGIYGPLPYHIICCNSATDAGGHFGPVQMCCNCGATGHTNINCREETIDSNPGSGFFRLEVIPKTDPD